MLLSWSQCQEKKTILAASHCEAEEIERVAMFWQSKSILNRKKMFWRSKPIPRRKNASWFYPKADQCGQQCGSVPLWHRGSVGSVVNTVWSTHTMKSWPNIGTIDFFCQKLVWFEIYDLLFTMVLLHSIRASCVFVYLYLYMCMCMCMCIRICLPCLVSMQGKRFNL